MSRQRNLAIVITLVVGSFFLCNSAGADNKSYIHKAVQKIVPEYKLSGTLAESFKQLQLLGGVPIRVDWNSLEATGVTPSTKVTLRGKKTKLVDILELMLFQVMKKGKPLGWYVDKDILWVSTQANVLKRNRTTAARGKLTQKRRVRSREITFDKTPLEDVIEYFREVTKLNFYVNWGALKLQDVTRKTPVSLRVRDVSIATVLDIMMRGLNGNKDKHGSVYWIVDSGIVLISTGEALDKTTRTRVTDIADILQIIPQFKGPRVKPEEVMKKPDDSGGESEPLFADPDEEKKDTKELSLVELKAKRQKDLIDAIKKTIGDDMWYPDGKGTIRIIRNKLIITQTLLGWKLMETANRR
ncbi:MAG: hypothetical protein K8S55_12190 [Phycisphaerae bacterium]|nr:hypothetical protein [Phycisphaerae bacterium]